MYRTYSILWMMALALIFCLRTPLAEGKQKKDDMWTKDFTVDKSELSTVGRNPYFILEPGYQLAYEGGRERLVITVLDETRTVDGVKTRVVEERETKGGKLVEVSRNFFAISKVTGDIYYFGEDVDIYRNDKVVSHEGAWQAGVRGAKFGMLLPGKVALNVRYYQEIAPGVALDRVQAASLSETVKTPAGEFKNCLKLEETTPLEPRVRDYKFFAAGIGMVQDGALKLVKYGKAEKTAK